MPKTTDVKVLDVRTKLSRYTYRTPMKFGNCVNTDTAVMEVAVRVQNRKFREAVGYGAMTRGIGWSFPGNEIVEEKKVAAMDRLVLTLSDELADLSGGEYLHPLDWGVLIESWIEREIQVEQNEMGLEIAIPLMAGLVAASPFDAAIHDGFGRANYIDCYGAYGVEYVNHDLAYYLDADYRDEYIEPYVLKNPKAQIPLYHLVGALDALTDKDVDECVQDGRPETLEEWILADGLTHLKLKLNGKDLFWDIDRVAAVNRIADQVDSASCSRNWQFSLDFNEQCDHVDYLLEFLSKIKEKSSVAFDRIQYIEQPTHRNLKAFPENKVHAASAIKPVVIDESLDGYESLLLSEEMGYSGVALKACKGQSQSLLMGAAAQKRNRFLCVQDLTCLAAGFMQSASLAAHVPTAAAVEGNGRQYCPEANQELEDEYPDVFNVTDGRIHTGSLAGVGLCGVPEEYIKQRFEDAI